MISYYRPDSRHPERKILDPDLVDSMALRAAESFFSDTRSQIRSSQLRKFYADVKRLELRWQTRGGDDATFAEILPLIRLLKAKSDYAMHRKVVPATFRDWICAHVDSIATGDDFRAFLLHFEAVVGFSYGVAPKDFD